MLWSVHRIEVTAIQMRIPALARRVSIMCAARCGSVVATTKCGWTHGESVQHGTTELKPTQQPSSLPTQQFSHSVLKLRNGDQKTAADTKRVFMTRAKFVLVAWFEIPAESMLFGWPKHEVWGNFSAD